MKVLAIVSLSLVLASAVLAGCGKGGSSGEVAPTVNPKAIKPLSPSSPNTVK